MKSILITFLIFIIVFGSIHLGILDVLSSTGFKIISILSFLFCILAAVYFVGKPDIKTLKNSLKLTNHDDNEDEHVQK